VSTSGFEVGDLVRLKWVSNKSESRYHIGIILKAPSIFSNSKLFEILWLTEDGNTAIVLGESFNLELLSAHEGNEARFAKYRDKNERR